MPETTTANNVENIITLFAMMTKLLRFSF